MEQRRLLPMFPPRYSQATSALPSSLPPHCHLLSAVSLAEAATAAAAQDRLGKGAGPRRPPSTSVGGSSDGGGGGGGTEDGPVLHVRWAAEDPNPRASELFVVFWCACSDQSH